MGAWGHVWAVAPTGTRTIGDSVRGQGPQNEGKRPKSDEFSVFDQLSRAKRNSSAVS